MVGSVVLAACGGISSTPEPASSNQAASTAAASGGAGAAIGAGGQGGGCVVPAPPACDAPPPHPGTRSDWNSSLTPVLVTSQGSPVHRGRDLFLLPDDEQWVLAKLTYGVADKDLEGEDVDVHLLRNCGSTWEHLGTAVTTGDGDHPTIEGVADTGGRVFFRIPAHQRLGLGRHRVHLVVKGDLSTTELFIEVVEPGTKIFVSDVDGTLTTAEAVEVAALLAGTQPDAHADAAAALGVLAGKGLVPFYLTARPEQLGERTRQFLAERGFPPGLVHTTLSKSGALGDEAVVYKSAELAAAAAKGLVIVYGFGNTESDGDAYQSAAIAPVDNRVFFQFDDVHGGRRIESYGELVPGFAELPPYCR